MEISLKPKLKILTFSAYYLPGYKGGGPIKTIKNLIDNTQGSLSYKVVTSDRDLGDSQPYADIRLNTWNSLENSEIFYLRSGLKGLRRMLNIITKKDYDVLYLNSFFSPRFSLTPLLMSKLTKKQVILGPRGEFSKGALSIKRPKKIVYISLFKLFRLQKSIVFQASSIYEKQDIIDTLGSNIDIYIAEDIGSQEFAEDLTLKDQKWLKGVFISRISPKKNLLLALNLLKDINDSVSYDIYGPIEDTHYWKQCENIISQLPSHIKVTYRGEIQPSEVIKTLSKYDFFFMPTQGENYGHVIAEALCAGLPLIISNRTPWRGLEQDNLGWDIDLDDIHGFRAAITKLSKLSANQLINKRQQILSWSKNKFSQDDAVQDNINMFLYAYKKMSENRK